MKSVSELGLTTWSELSLSLKKAGFEPQHIHQIINSKDNKLAKALFELFEMRGGETVLRLDHQDRVGRCYVFDYQDDGLSFLDIARIITFAEASTSVEDVIKMLVEKGMTYSQKEIDSFGEQFLLNESNDPPDMKESMVALLSHASSVFFVHNEDKSSISVVYPCNASSLGDEDLWKLEYLALEDNTSKVAGYNFGPDDGISTVGVFINVQ